jgi:Uma2 family endonuclease
VLSESTEAYDRGEKFENYKSVPSLEAYVLVHQQERKMEVFSRTDGWKAQVAQAGQVIEIPAIDVRLSVAEIY